MSVKRAEDVDRYAMDVLSIVQSLRHLITFAESLPAPDENNELATLHYGHTGSISLLSQRLREAVDGVKDFHRG